MSSNPYENPKSDRSFDEAIGEFRGFYASLGRVVTQFAILEETVTDAIGVVAGIDEELTDLIFSEMMFRSKVTTLGALVRKYADRRPFNPWLGSVEESWSELERQCLEANQKRNAAIHSSWEIGHRDNPDGVVRVATTTRGKRGHRTDRVPMTEQEVLDISEYITLLCYYFIEFMPPAAKVQPKRRSERE